MPRLLRLHAFLVVGLAATATAAAAAAAPIRPSQSVAWRGGNKRDGLQQQLPPLKNHRLQAAAAAGGGVAPAFLARRGGRRRGELSFDESEVDRGNCLARAWAVAALQLSVMAAAVHRLYLPETLRPLLLESGNAGLLKGVGAGSVVNLVLVSLLASGSWVRRFPLNVVVLGGITAIKALLASALAERFGPAVQQPLLLLTGQGAATLLALALLASRNMGEGLLPYAVAAALCLLPARGVALLLGWPIRPVMVGGAGAFLASLLLVFVTQSAVRGAAHRGGARGRGGRVCRRGARHDADHLPGQGPQ